MSTYTTTVTIPLILVADDRESAAGHVDALLAAILADAASQGATLTAPHIDPLRTVTAPSANPRFIVQHGHEAGTRRVIEASTGKPVNDIVYTDADGQAPFLLRDRLNALPRRQVAR